MTPFLLDANVFIQAKNTYYSFEICPGFWAWMDHIVAGGNVSSTIMVRDELLTGNDELAEWIDARKKASWFLKEDDAATQGHFTRIASAVQAGQYTSAAKDAFLRGADPWLVAKAKTTGATVVTLEKEEPESKRRVPLPNVCRGETVPFINTFELLQTMEVKFHHKLKVVVKKATKPGSKKK